MTVNNLAVLPAECFDDETLRELVSNAKMLQAQAASTKVIEDEYTVELFRSFAFFDDSYGPRERLPISSPDALYLSRDETEVHKYMEALDAAHKAHGFSVQPGQSPSSVLRRRARQAETAILEYVDTTYLHMNFDRSTEGYRRRTLQLLYTAFEAS